MSHTITPKQSMKARSLLKWNVYDVVSKCNLSPVRLERFERASLRLSRPENDELYRLYTKFGLIFTADFEVLLADTVEDHSDKVDLNDTDAQEINADEMLKKLREEREKTAQKEEKEKEKEAEKIWVYAPDYTGPDRRNLANQRHYTGTERRADRKDLVRKVMEKYGKNEGG